ncbi:MAG TPA: hypothetical protein VIJ79_03710 [Acidobacteriaceae bacterium]
MTVDEQLCPCPIRVSARAVRLPADRDGESMLHDAVAAMMAAA